MVSSYKNSIGFKINQTANRINNRFNEVLNQYDIAPEQRATLEIIKTDKNTNQKEIASILGKNKTTISRSLKALEKKGFIKRVEIKEDKRVNIIELTQKGEEVLKESAKSVAQFRQNLSLNLQEEEIKQLFSLLDKVYKNIKETF
ncbi:MarR family winged helix-turn-helix transcriptional regulator [Malaciobacter mytili]|uniref:HTH marR-type domain-containing protein n=1 Tax=Malaciobacter mytili LMG 24559 TaxID=1032238 RepID=A0AAX2ADA4_9BACT|nr:MarR family transcriptional regulator [Malaciobacter mytili]AXH16254.1 transcriptional regulator, MarR family [Malaciobacter mytili LMG 24559]RXI42384.1 hypothetical protein CRU99_09140 [Malaciobacter mytili]RXK13767.1 hypothetical protein CP985_12530 [Malaciobacter mytili LMG 24559]